MSAPGGRMPLLEHLRELRSRLLKAAAAVLIATVAAWFFFDPVWDFLKEPYCGIDQTHRLGSGCTLVVNGIFDAFFLKLRVSIILGLVASCPVWLWQVWAFVAPGLHKTERKWTYAFVAAAVPLFVLGAGISYVFIDKGLALFLGFAPADVVPLITVKDYLRYVTTTLLVFGLSFEFPLLLVVLNLARVLTYQRMRGWWRGMIIGIFVFAAFITPSQDAFTMSVMAAFMCLFYGLALLFARAHDHRRPAAPYADLSDDEPSPLEV
jgi:sec-independent protein translocase protein TatC